MCAGTLEISGRFHRRAGAVFLASDDRGGDLGSHLYNAWLAQLVERGQAPGFWLAWRWNNVLFDYWLDGLGRILSLQVAVKIAVSFAVLIFFWGMFALACAATRRAPWYLCPCIAMFTYGYTFHMGFMNFYISLGLAFFGMAILWRGKRWDLACSRCACSVHYSGASVGSCVAGGRIGVRGDRGKDPTALSGLFAGCRRGRPFCRALLFLAPRYGGGAAWTNLLLQRNRPTAAIWFALRDSGICADCFYICRAGCGFFQTLLGAIAAGRLRGFAAALHDCVPRSGSAA